MVVPQTEYPERGSRKWGVRFRIQETTKSRHQEWTGAKMWEVCARAIWWTGYAGIRTLISHFLKTLSLERMPKPRVLVPAKAVHLVALRLYASPGKMPAANPCGNIEPAGGNLESQHHRQPMTDHQATSQMSQMIKNDAANRPELRSQLHDVPDHHHRNISHLGRFTSDCTDRHTCCDLCVTPALGTVAVGTVRHGN